MLISICPRVSDPLVSDVRQRLIGRIKTLPQELSPVGRLRGILTVGVAPTRLDSTHLSSGSTTLLGRFLPVEMGFRKDKMDHYFDIYFNKDNNDYLSRHPEIERFGMPKTFYFRYLPDRLAIHWAIIKPADGYVNVYFINNIGRVFDKLEFKNVKIARRRLRKCGFDYSTNKCCKETPREPIYIQLREGKNLHHIQKVTCFKVYKETKVLRIKQKNPTIKV